MNVLNLQVANFIVKNSQPAPVMNAAPQFADPFTGGNRYIPGSAAPARSVTNSVKTPSASSSSSSVSQSYIPHTTYLKLEQANIPAITGNQLMFSFPNQRPRDYQSNNYLIC